MEFIEIAARMEAAAASMAASLNASKRANDAILKEMEESTKVPEASDTETEPTVSPPTPISAKRAREEATDEPLVDEKEAKEAEEPKAKEAKVDPTSAPTQRMELPMSTVPRFNGQKPKELYVMYKSKFPFADYHYKGSDDDLSFTLNIHPRPTDPLPKYFVVAIYERVLASEPSDWHARVFAYDEFTDSYHAKPMGFFGARPFDDWLLGFVRVAGDKRRIPLEEDEKPLPTTEEVMKLVQE